MSAKGITEGSDSTSFRPCVTRPRGNRYVRPVVDVSTLNPSRMMLTAVRCSLAERYIRESLRQANLVGHKDNATSGEW